MCQELIEQAKQWSICPVRIYPSCHKNAKIDVYVDHEKSTIEICCSTCDRIIETIKVHKKKGKK